jgi:DNA-binding transcriptional LysR family regulator
MITLKSMRYASTALRLGSIARAAQELHVAASAISAALDQIEAHFGLTLVTRQRARGITPTADGRALVQRFDGLLKEYDSLLAAGAARKDGASGTLRIGYYAPVAPAFLPQILRGLMAPEHRLTLQLEECDNTAAQAGLREGLYDVILFVADGAEPLGAVRAADPGPRLLRDARRAQAGAAAAGLAARPCERAAGGAGPPRGHGLLSAAL